MGLAEIQTALARLYTDSELRKRFLENPESIGHELGLKREEAEQLSNISTDELDFFSDSLVWKRLNEAEKLLPLTSKVLGEKFKQHFQVFASAYNPKEIKKHLEDTIAFCAFLEKKIETGWMVDLIRFEKARLQLGELTRKLFVRRFNYDIISEIEKGLTDGNKSNPEKKKWTAVWYRFSRNGRWKFYKLYL